MLLANWNACEVVDFVILTDRAPEWRSKAPEASRIRFVTTDIAEYFDRGARVLGFASTAELMDTHGDKLYGRTDGWTACGLRGLLPLMYPVHEGQGGTTHTHRGWIDNDVLLDQQMLRRHLFKWGDRALVMFTEAGMLFEQVKLLRRDVDVLGVYRELLRHMFSDMPLEAACVYRLRGIGSLTRDVLPAEAIAVHWAYLDERAEGAPYRRHVIVGPDWSLRDVIGGERLLLLICDSEVKYTRGEHMSLMYHADASLMRQAFLASTGG